MITGIRISSVEASRTSDEEIKGLDINIGIEAVKVIGPEVEITFTYTATYQQNVGVLKMGGSILSHEDPKYAKEIADAWAKDKHLPDAYSELVLNAVNFTCGTNGTLVVRPVNLAPPMVPPRIELNKGGASTPEPPTAPGGRRGRSA
ncbi:MAG: hypothetical protein KGH63_02480 [Candidatus Micrarchaeota archaeon]|nr:hypothetical protein [Candidatus Micrarchaeota archaeon]